jgi:mRNA interferase RelE/StbE
LTTRKVRFLGAAATDIERLAKDDPVIGRLAALKVHELARGDVVGEPLAEMASTGDLSDCFKLYFGIGSPPSHRIVYIEIADTGPPVWEIVEIVAVEERDDLYAYLLASSRLGRLPPESKPTFNRLHQVRIKRRSRRR